MVDLKQIFNKNTPIGRTIRTWIQAFIGITAFALGLIGIPGVAEFVTQNYAVTIGSLATAIAVVTYIQNALERLLAFLSK
jgi:uncharacterized membrane protein (DUF485 family)